ncbi:hypothetical protein KXQ82_03490 [Mucilaginibacter sp. HMF5004]|uniref:hypothetical protein n=1 Tax=Mucilaginibacter rivuli TaxID=2857527 RepID=UPI001C5F066F|nr:hypothetical protein [Mucilaginibacter rivuli]MBW4888757.1 hypothetical protein [Mucilaginibacter rivuli]
MKKITLLAGLTMLIVFNCLAQEDGVPTGYKLKHSMRLIKVYQDRNNKPDLADFNFWINDYWFKIDKTEVVDRVEYIRITIPTTISFNNTTKKFEPEPHYENPLRWREHGWPDGVPIDSDDFNSWLWIAKADFDEFKEDYFGKVPFQFVFSGMAIPFKYRPAEGTHASSILNGDINIGTFLGIRLPIFNNTGGINFGGSLGVSSLPMNASNNHGILDNSSESISGFNYGAAVIFDWQKKFQIGLVMGYDHGVGDLSRSYIYQDKSWFAISFNYKFLDFDSAPSKPKQHSENEVSKAGH